MVATWEKPLSIAITDGANYLEPLAAPNGARPWDWQTNRAWRLNNNAAGTSRASSRPLGTLVDQRPTSNPLHLPDHAGSCCAMSKHTGRASSRYGEKPLGAPVRLSVPPALALDPCPDATSSPNSPRLSKVSKAGIVMETFGAFSAGAAKKGVFGRSKGFWMNKKIRRLVREIARHAHTSLTLAFSL